MSQFPILTTGAVMQYPAGRELAFGTHVVRFVDGKEQRTRTAAILRRWIVGLDLVDEAELAAVDAFFCEQQGASGVFSFTDPWDGKVYASCSIDAGEFRAVFEGPRRGRAQIVIRENKT